MKAALRRSSIDDTNFLCNAALLYFVIFSVGLCKLTWVGSQYFNQHLDFHAVVSQMCDWVSVFPHNKLPQLLFFGFSLVALFGFWGIYCGVTAMMRRGHHPLKLYRQELLIVYFAIAAIVNIGLMTQPKYLVLDLLVWMVSFGVLPIYLYSQQLRARIVKFETRWRVSPTLMWLSCGLVTGILVAIFYPLVMQPLLIANDFLDIPEQTILQKRVVDNTEYINQHHIAGLHIYDPRTDHGVVSESPRLAKIKLPRLPVLSEFLRSKEHDMFFYDDATQSLSLKGAMSRQDFRYLLEIYQADKQHQQQIKILYEQAQHNEILNKRQTYNAEQQEFIEKNTTEMTEKMKAGWMFFHHSWVLHPILAVALGADAGQQVFLYGYGSAMALKYLLVQMGGISFQNYFKLSFAVYPIYFFMFLAAIYWIFRRADFVCLGALLLSVSFFCLGYQMILLAPGYNPMRHVFDMVLLVAFVRYLQKNTVGSLGWVLVLGCGAIIWSKDFGLLLMLALLITAVIRNRVMHRRAYGLGLLAVFGILLAVFCYRLPIHGVNYNFIYMLLGYTLPTANIFKIIIILIAISVGYIAYSQCRKLESEYYWLSLSLFFYLQLQLIYYIWYPSLQHFLVLAPVVIIWGMTWLYGFNKEKKTYMFGMQSIVLGTVLLLYLPSLYFFYSDRQHYLQTFSTHIVHKWPFEYGAFTSTMDPQLFGDTLRMIEHHMPHTTSMYLISKYDDILPVLAHRYNGLPVVNLALDLLSNRDIDRCVQAIERDKPQYIWVDSDIHRDLRGDVMLPYDFWEVERNYPESYGRFAVMKNMRILYQRIRNEYSPLAQGSLLTVYERKTGL